MDSPRIRAALLVGGTLGLLALAIAFSRPREVPEFGERPKEPALAAGGPTEGPAVVPVAERAEIPNAPTEPDNAHEVTKESPWRGGCTVLGRVEDPEGRAAAGAEVRFLGREERRTTTALDGSFALDSLTPDREFELFVEHDLGSTSRSQQRTATGVVDLGLLRLQASTEVRGTVTDEHGAPVGDVAVVIEGLPPIRTTAQGTFALSHVPSGFHALRAWRDGYRLLEPRCVDLRGESVSLSLVLTRGWLLQGTVRDAEGLPLEQVRVSTNGWAEEDSVRTDPDGHYGLCMRSGSRCEVRFRLDGYESAEVVLDAVPREDLDVVLERKCTVDVLLTDAVTGEIVTEVRAVELSRRSDPFQPRHVSQQRLRTGELRLALDQFQNASIRFLAPGRAALEWPLSYASLDEVPRRVHLTFSGGATVHLACLDEEARPLHGVEVQCIETSLASSADRSFAAHQSRSSHGRILEQEGCGGFAFSDAKGEAVLRNVVDGAYVLTLVHPAMATRQIDLSVEAGKDVDLGALTLDTGGRIEGVVRTERGDPAGGRRLVLVSSEGNQRTTHTSREGAYEFTKLSPGSYQVDAVEEHHPSLYRVGEEWWVIDSRGNYSTLREEHLDPLFAARESQRSFGVEVLAGVVVRHDLTVQGPATGTVRGTVSILGDPASSFEVLALAPDPSREGAWRRVGRTATDLAGNYLLDSLPSGPLRLKFRSGEATWHEQEVEVVEGKDTVLDPRIPAGFLVVTVEEASSHDPVSDVRVVVTGTGFGGPLLAARTDDAGRVEFGPLPLGRYSSTVLSPGQEIVLQGSRIDEDGASVPVHFALVPGRWLRLLWNSPSPPPPVLEYRLLGPKSSLRGLLDAHDSGVYWFRANEESAPAELQLTSDGRAWTFSLTRVPWPKELEFGDGDTTEEGSASGR